MVLQDVKLILQDILKYKKELESFFRVLYRFLFWVVTYTVVLLSSADAQRGFQVRVPNPHSC